MPTIPTRSKGGHFREVVTLYDPAKIAAGLNQQVESPEIVLDGIPCNITPIDGGETIDGGIDVVQGSTHILEMRFTDELQIKPSFFFVWDRQPFGLKRLDVLDVRDPDSFRRKLFVYCRQVPMADFVDG